MKPEKFYKMRKYVIAFVLFPWFSISYSKSLQNIISELNKFIMMQHLL